MIQFPLTTKFRATTYFKAFLLYSIIITLSTFIGYITHFYLDRNHNIPIWSNILITIIIAFISCLLIHIFMFYVFAFGGGMLTYPKARKEYHIHSQMRKLKNKK